MPDSTSLKFILLGTLTRKSKDKGSKGERHVVVHMDFESLKKRRCTPNDLEKWYARTIGGQPDCLMGHKVPRTTFPPPFFFPVPARELTRVGLCRVQQWFMRRKQDADCFIGEKWKDPIGREENCACSDEDYEW